MNLLSDGNEIIQDAASKGVGLVTTISYTALIQTKTNMNPFSFKIKFVDCYFAFFTGLRMFQ